MSYRGAAMIDKPVKQSDRQKHPHIWWALDMLKWLFFLFGFGLLLYGVTGAISLQIAYAHLLPMQITAEHGGLVTRNFVSFIAGLLLMISFMPNLHKRYIRRL